MAYQTVEDFFNAHTDKAKEYVTLAVARPIAAGEQISNQVFFGPWETALYESPQEDGYLVKDYNYLSVSDAYIVSASELTADTAYDLSTAESPIAKRDLANGETLTPISQNTVIPNTNAPAHFDGFIFKKDGNPVDIQSPSPYEGYRTNHEIRSAFNTVAAPSVHDEIIFAFRAESPVKGLLVEKDITLQETFCGKTTDVLVPAGSVIVCQEGCHSILSQDLAAVALRVKPEKLEAPKRLVATKPGL